MLYGNGKEKVLFFNLAEVSIISKMSRDSNGIYFKTNRNSICHKKLYWENAVIVMTSQTDEKNVINIFFI